MDLNRAIEVFVRGFCHGKSRTHPYIPKLVGGLWVMQDAPRNDPRKIEIIAWDREPFGVVEEIGRQELGWHFLCHISSDAAELKAIKAAYKDQGYRSIGTEWLYFHDLAVIPRFTSDPPARFVGDPEVLSEVPQTVPKGHQRKIIEGRDLFGVWTDSREVGWVDSVPLGPDAWVSGLYVWEDMRSKGYGKSLMSCLVQHEKATGVEYSVLTASTAGNRIYPSLGYQLLGTLQMFCPVSRS